MGHYDPRCEAVSKEIAALRRCPRQATVVSLTPRGRPAGIESRRTLWLRPAMYRALARPLAWWMSRSRPIHHVFSNWPATPFLARLSGQAVVLTQLGSFSSDAKPMQKGPRPVSLLVVECRRDRDEALARGWNPETLRWIHPGVDPREFREADVPAREPFTLLFAGVPFLPGYAEARGVDLVLDAARRMPDVRFRLLCREYVPANVGEACLEGLGNLVVETWIHGDMPSVYAACHATLAPFRAGPLNKSCPNSLVESLAMGRPVLASKEVGIAPLVAEQGVGEVFAPTLEGLTSAIESLRIRYVERRRGARACAEKFFALDRFLRDYCGAYAEVSKSTSGTSRA
jgi:glycosyltransferase involved in cell wall biosynthesis